MLSDIRWKERFENFCSALKTIAEVLPRYKDLSTIEQDGLIQRFEFTFELAWKVMQDYLLFTGYQGLRGPRNVIKQMAADTLLDQFVWDDMLEARNTLTHAYDESKSRAYLDRIVFDYFPALQQFKQTMEAIR